MAGSEDPRLDRVIAALNTLDATQRAQAELIDTLRSELSAAQREVAAAREAAAFAKAETATYHAELAAMARRSDIERLVDRLDAVDVAVSALRRGDAQATSVREQVVKLSRALTKAASMRDLGELAQRIEQIDDRLQVRLDHLARDVTLTAEANQEHHALLAQISGDTGDVGQALDRRMQEIEDSQLQLAERFDRVIVTAESEIERVAGHLEKRVLELCKRVDQQEDALADLVDPEVAVDEVRTEVGDIKRTLSVLRSTMESDRTVVRELDQRVFGVDGVGPRLLQLAEVVVDQSARDVIPTPVDPQVLEFQTRLEELIGRVEGLAALRARVELLERHADR